MTAQEQATRAAYERGDLIDDKKPAEKWLGESTIDTGVD